MANDTTVNLENIKTKSVWELREVVRDTPEFRLEAGLRLLDNDPSRLDLRYVIEFVDSLRDKAWASLKARVPTQFEPTYIALNVPVLRDEAWKLLVQTKGFESELPSIANRCPELRERCWEIMLEQDMKIWDFQWTALPSAPHLIDKIWNRMQCLDSPIEVCKVAIRHPLLLNRAIGIAVKDKNWCPSTLLHVISESHRKWEETWNDGYNLKTDLLTKAVDIWKELRRQRPDTTLELLSAASKSSDKLLVLLYSGDDLPFVWNVVKSEIDTLELHEVMIQIPSLRNEAWEQFKSRYDPTNLYEDASFVPFTRLGEFQETVWQFLLETTRQELFGPRFWPRESLPFMRRDWDQIKDSLCFSSLLSIIRDLHTQDAVFDSLVVKQLAITCPSFSDFLKIFDCYTWDERVCTSPRSPSPVLDELQTKHGLLNVDELGQLHWRSPLDRPAIEARLLDLNLSLAEVIYLQNLDLDKSTVTALSRQILNHPEAVPTWVLCKLIHLGISSSKAISADQLRTRLESESNETLIEIAGCFDSFAEEIFEIVCERPMDMKSLMAFVKNVPSARERAIAILRKTNDISNCDLVWLLKHFPTMMGDSHKNFKFGCGSDGWSQNGMLVFIDVDALDLESTDANYVDCSTDPYIDWAIEGYRRRKCIGRRMILGFSSHKYFDADWWEYGDQSQYHPDIEPNRPLVIRSPSEPNEFGFSHWLEREINRSYLNPDIKEVQVVKILQNAFVDIQVEFKTGVVDRGWLTWRRFAN